ncbi:hypothetical protein Poly30_23170 [Planctomycetes bacterium Poly30]|uniref:Uncharacterized protein n=1 Tax=Saltatorellus ferox TaxID=2528018 RepID=A0A518ERW1_9BACT|nr:hypothetical protein Poly30_23170 [Planctomycetes bacterium Poly30]
MQALSPKHVLRTERGKSFHIDLDAGYSFGMCLDVAKTLLRLQSYGRPTLIPALKDLNPESWEVIRANYEPDHPADNRHLIEASGMKVASQTPLIGFGAHFLNLVYSVIDVPGTSVFSLLGYGGSHELLWHRDDEHGMWLFFDPFSGLWQFDSMAGVAPTLAAELVSRYDDLGQLYRVSTLVLK